MAFCTYLYRDPKTSVLRYVGKGLMSRPFEHFSCGKRSHQQLRRMLAKRKLEGFDPKPVIIKAKSEADAFEMEELLISMIGRLDIGTGTLFNNTNGGEGESGRVCSQETRKKCSISFHSRSEEEKAKTFALLSSKKKAMWARMSDEQKSAHLQKIAKSKCQPCTIDGQTIYESRKALIQALGQSHTGSRSPNFRYV